MITNELGLPKPFVEAVTRDYQYKPKRYSVTDLLGGTCAAVLKRRHANESDEDVSDMVWAIFGSAVHKILEESGTQGTQMREQKMAVELDDGYVLSGIADLYDPETGTVTDWKTCSTWKVTFGDFSDWRTQTLLYCWMLRRLGFKADRGEIVAIMRDHSMRKARFESGYPKHPVLRISWEFTDEDMRDAQRRIADWFSAVSMQELLDDDELEPCSDSEVWHKPDKWAVMEVGRRKALRLLDSEKAAIDWAKSKGIDTTDPHYYLELREGKDTRCSSYCPVSRWCPRGQKSSQASR